MAEHELPTQLLDSIAEAAIVAFREVAGTEVFLQTAIADYAANEYSEQNSYIHLKFSSGNGLLVLSVTKRIAVALAERVLAGQTLPLDESLINDCLGEIVNVIAGQGKAMLSGSDWHYTFGTPYVSEKPSLSEHGLKSGRVILTFQSDLGALTLHLYV